MSTRWQIFQLPQTARYDELPLTNVSLFSEEGFSGCLLGFLPGQELPVHRHAHEHEVFDILSGQGTLYLDGDSVELTAGHTAFVPAGVLHGFKNTGQDLPANIHPACHPPCPDKAIEPETVKRSKLPCHV